jgi:hypothetical protein
MVGANIKKIKGAIDIGPSGTATPREHVLPWVVKVVPLIVQLFRTAVVIPLGDAAKLIVDAARVCEVGAKDKLSTITVLTFLSLWSRYLVVYLPI